MFDYYRFRFRMLNGWTPELGYELMAPAGLFGVALIGFVSYLSSPDFGLLMWRANVPEPGKYAFGLVLVLLIATYIADDLKRPGLWLIVSICISGLGATGYGAYSIANGTGSRIEYGQTGEPTSAYIICVAFATYLLLMLGLTASRLRESNDL